jgi:hypothetical protein
MSKPDNRIERAMEIALSCRACRTTTDAKFDKESKTWITYYECGKTARYENSEIVSETKGIIKTLPKKR